MKKVIIHSDGACSGNPGPGGYAAVITYGTQRKEISGAFRLTTNNRMEIIAAIAGLETLKGACMVTLVTDSQYLCNSITKGWAKNWQAKGWKKGGKAVTNTDLWKIMLALCEKHKVEFTWIRGHAGNIENERCDLLARQALQQPALPPDVVYEAVIK